MKFIIPMFLIAVGTSAANAAKTAAITCQTKSYACHSGGCAWTSSSTQFYSEVELRRLNRETWKGRLQFEFEGHIATVDLTHSTEADRPELKAHAYLSASGVMAETSGVESVELSLRNNTYGRGFVCRDFSLLD